MKKKYSVFTGIVIFINKTFTKSTINTKNTFHLTFIQPEIISAIYFLKSFYLTLFFLLAMMKSCNRFLATFHVNVLELKYLVLDRFR